MRTDAKIGFAIVGVLVLVLVVYALVIPKGKTGRQANVNPVPAKIPADPATGETGDGVHIPPDDAGPSTVVPPRSSDVVRPPLPGGDTARTGGSSTVIDPLHPGAADTDHGHAAPAPPATHRDDVAADPHRPAPPVAAATHKYTVKQGDTLSSIAVAEFGTSQAWHQIAELNPTVKPERLRPKMVLTLPDAASIRAARTAAAATVARDAARPRDEGVIPASVVRVLPPADVVGTAGDAVAEATGSTYTIRKNDSLYQIARRHLGSGQRADELYDLNRDVIGTDPTHLKVGMVLRLPAAPGGMLSDAALR